MEATRLIYWNTNGKSLMYVFSGLMLMIFCIGMRKRIGLWRVGQPIVYKNLGLRLKKLLKDLLIHDQGIFKGSFRRVMHWGIFFGFIILFIGTLEIAIQEDFHIPLFYGKVYLWSALLMDLFGLLCLIGIVMAVYKRYIVKPDHAHYTFDDALLLAFIFIVLLTGFILEGLRIYITSDPWSNWSPVGLLLSLLIRKLGLSISSARLAHAGLWYFHMVLALGFIAYLPYSKLFHMIATSLTLILRSYSPIGTLNSSNQAANETEPIGVESIEDFSWKQLMELDACISCLRCQKGCPATTFGAQFSPREMIQALKRQVRGTSLFLNTQRDREIFSRTIVDQIISKETLWSCATCGLCEDKCPASLEHIKRIVDMRRSLVKTESGYPEKVWRVFEHLESVGNPWGTSPREHDHWTPEFVVPRISTEKQVEVLYWLGCFGSHGSRTMKVSEAMFKIMTMAGVDFAILGGEESCCGDSVRRLGHEALFQQLAKKTIKTLNQYKFQTIVTHCPHCLNTIKNEFPELGGRFEVLHHSEFLLGLLESGKIMPKESRNRKITFHDPCYLGRYNQQYSAPREVLSNIPDLDFVEMKNNQARAFCCGAGGGRIWMDDNNADPITSRLVEKALKTKADILVSACSMCLTRLTETVNASGVELECKDLAEMISESL